MARILVDLLSYTGTKGGMETYTRELYRQLGTMDTGHRFVGFASNELVDQGLDHSWFPGKLVRSGYSGENRFVWAFGELAGVGLAARRTGAELVHCPATLGPAFTGVPTVVTMHDMLYFSHPDLMSTPLYTEPVKAMEKLVSRNATRVLTVSQVSSQEIQRYLKVPPDRIDVVPLAAAPPQVTDGLVRRDDLLLAVGNRRPHKNFDGLLRALALVEPQVRPHLVVTGSRGDDPLAPLVAELDLGDWVDLRSWLTDEELGELYGTATALVMPSFAEGFGIPVLEAMGVGLPTVVSDLPVFREVADDAALYVDPSDPASLAAAITRLVTEPGLPAALASAGRQRFGAFSWERVAQGTLESFERALATRGGRP